MQNPKSKIQNLKSTFPLPFDALRPFKNRPDDFTPRDTIPWEAQAGQLLRCRTETGFMGLRPFRQIEEQVTWLVETLALPAGAEILDIGCGPGLYSNCLGKYGYRVTGIDIAQPLLDYAQAEAQTQGLPCTFQRRSLLDLDLEARFDAVVLINTILNMLTPAQLSRALGGIQTILKSGGHLIADFSPLPCDFAAAEPTITEEVTLLPCSPWCDQFHALMTRRLTFPARHERVTHYLLLTPAGPPSEYWTRATLYSLETFTQHLAQYDLQLYQDFGQNPGQPPQMRDKTCFIWAGRSAHHLPRLPSSSFPFSF